MQPADDAVNSYGVGVGLIVIVPADTELEEGMVDNGILDLALGWSTNISVIWRDASAQDLGWSVDFPVGFECGRCVPSTGMFDSFTPVACIGVDMDLSATNNICNWT